MAAGRRRPEPQPDPVAASTSTLNHFLGGKQKSWMVSGAQNVPRAPATQLRPRPANRTNVYTAPQPNQSSTSRISRSQSQENLERHPASNSTSPQLANTLSPRKDVLPRPTADAILLSPAPSDDLNTDPTNDTANQTEDDAGRGTGAADNISNHNSSRGRQNGAFTPEGQMVTARKRPMEPDVLAMNKRHVSEKMQALRATGIEMLLQSQTINAERVQAQHEVILAKAQALAQAKSRSHEQAQLQDRNPAEAVAQSMAHIQDAQVQAQAQTQAQAQASVQAEAQVRTEAAAATEAQQRHRQSPALQSPAPTDDYFTSDDCNQPLRHLISRFGGMHGFQIRDGQRIRLLKEAVDSKDFAYLSIHQYFCLATVNYNSLPPNLRALPALPKALDCISQVLDSNSNISPWLVQWFSNFPMPLGQIAVSWPTKYKQQQEAFARFADRTGMHFFDLKRRCVERRYPPLVRELFEELGIVSAVFQRVVFLATLRSFWAQTGGQMSLPVSQAEDLFHKNQVEYHRQVTQKQTPQILLYSKADISRENENYGRRYKLLHLQHENMFRRGSFPPNASPQQGQPQQRQQSQRPQQPQQLQHRRVRPPSELNLPRRASNPAVHVQIQNLRWGDSRVGVVRPPVTVVSSGARTISEQPSIASVPAVQRHQQVHQQPRRGLLFPPRGSIRAQPSQPNPTQSALHQAHLRSPILKPEQGTPESGPKVLYQFVKGFAIFPTMLTANSPTQLWKFKVSEKDVKTIPKDQPGELGEPPTRVIGELTQTYRLRSIKWTSPRAPDESAWMAAENSWLPYTYFKLNEHILHPRKKLHNGKDLPIDLTPHLKEGENSLQIAVMHQIPNRAPLNCALAIEIVGVKSHEEIKQDCFRMNRIPTEQVKAAIKTSLAGLDGDDEIAIVSSNISINLFDPFSACRIFDVPVRGRECLHHDCFDLQTFLQTRRRKQPTWPTAVDEWKCPLCKADVRPQNLMVDGFMEEVRAKLSEQNMLDTRTIVVEQDGSWKPKPEIIDKSGIQDRDSPDEDDLGWARAAQSASTPPTSRPDAMVIDLSD